MVDFDIQTVSIVIASAGVFFAAIYYILQIRHQTRIRKADLIMRLHSQVNSKTFMEAYQELQSIQFNDYDDFVEKFGPLYSKGPEQTAVIMIAYLMEGIGVLLHEKLADIEALKELFPIERVWEKLAPVLLGYRKQVGDPEIYEWFECLYNEVKKREQKGVKNG
jgi:hypothetical protein